DASVVSLAFHCNGDILAGTTKQISEFEAEVGFYVFQKYDNTWRRINSGPSDHAVFELAVHPNGHFFAVTHDGVFRSSDHGEIWQPINSGLQQTTNIFALTMSANGDLYVGALRNLYRSTDNGDSWHELTAGMPETNVHTLAINSDGIIFAGTDDGVFRSLEAVSTGEDVHNCIALTFRLEQNYPNPFNASTTIQFYLAEQTKVKITVFDVLGREVATLVDEELPQGSHERVFEADNLPSNVYFYRLEAGDFGQTKRLTLVK
ncbi:T9SS type A sorting domain-containing protein, partial [candidate division KSB1 bacterium]|nr:T9SS type A sorting domain-containing protein [candidate division KSB1 bacterium]